MALTGGTLLVSAVLELIKPSMENAPLGWALTVVFLGAAVFSGLDYLVKKKFGSGSGGGLLAAITLDGIPENLALGVSLIGSSPLAVAALSGSIFLSNLPEAAGGAKEMAENNFKNKVFWLWAGTAVLLSVCALLGNFLLENRPKETLAYIRCFAGGAVVGSIAIEVFPKAFKQDNYWAVIAIALVLVLTFYLNSLGK
jgi:ZIP family zinc transporter